jgi:hypothetical protein
VKLKKTLKTLSSGQKTQKNPKKPKKPKKTQKNPLGWVFLKKPGFFPTLFGTRPKYFLPMLWIRIRYYFHHQARKSNKTLIATVL